MEDHQTIAALRRALRNAVESSRGQQAHSVDIQSQTWEDRARTPFRSILDSDDNTLGAYGLGSYDTTVYG